MQTQPQTPTRRRAHLVFAHRPAGQPARMPRLLLGSVAAAAVLLAVLALLGYWQAEAGAASAARPMALPAAAIPAPAPVPAASEVLGTPTPVPDEPVATF